MRLDEQENDYEDLLSQTHENIFPNLNFSVDTSDQDNENLENELNDTTNQTENLSEEEQLKAFEKRVVYLLLTLQSVFYTSDAAVNFVVGSLAELFLAISTKNLVRNFYIIDSIKLIELLL